jgi:hypothetical protein
LRPSPNTTNQHFDPLPEKPAAETRSGPRLLRSATLPSSR